MADKVYRIEMRDDENAQISIRAVGNKYFDRWAKEMRAFVETHEITRDMPYHDDVAHLTADMTETLVRFAATCRSVGSNEMLTQGDALQVLNQLTVEWMQVVPEFERSVADLRDGGLPAELVDAFREIVVRYYAFNPTFTFMSFTLKRNDNLSALVHETGLAKWGMRFRREDEWTNAGVLKKHEKGLHSIMETIRYLPGRNTEDEFMNRAEELIATDLGEDMYTTIRATCKPTEDLRLLEDQVERVIERTLSLSEAKLNQFYYDNQM